VRGGGAAKTRFITYTHIFLFLIIIKKYVSSTKILANCERVAYLKKTVFRKNQIKKLMVDRIELNQMPIERAMSGLLKEPINQKPFLKIL
jgi:hypothetical protein